MTFLTPTKITRWHVNGWKCKNSWKTEIKKNFLPLDWFFPNLKHVFSSVVRWKQEQFLRFCPFYPVWEKGKHKSPARLPHDHYFCQIATWISNYLVISTSNKENSCFVTGTPSYFGCIIPQTSISLETLYLETLFN
jgi:hypothetical protein